MLWAIYCVDIQNSAPLRAKVLDQHIQYFNEKKDRIFVSGPQQSDDASVSLGSLFIIDASSHAEVQELLDNEPFNRAGVFESVRITRFRCSRFFNPQLADAG